MRTDARRVLVVTPESLVKQWHDELFETPRGRVARNLYKQVSSSETRLSAAQTSVCR